LLLVAKSESANDLIKELSQTEEEKLQDEFARVAKLSDAQARAELDEKFDKGPKLESFCRANSIPVSKKGARVDRKATYMHVLNALASFRERQKL